MVVRFFDFSRFNGKPPQGSTNIRVNQLIKYWDEAESYKYGEKVDVMIFQKVYVSRDYKFPVNLKAIKILDLCDTDWFDGSINIIETINAMDAVTCSSEGLTKHVSQLTKKPVLHVPDRFDLEPIPKPVKHVGKAKNLVWFGYSHNAGLLKAAIPYIERNKMHLTIISNDDPIVYRWSPYLRDNHTFVKYEEETIYEELQKHDIALLPVGNRPIDKYKSNNKTIKSILAGLPVATNAEELDKYSDPKERNQFIKDNHDTIKQQYDVRKSVQQYKDLIDEAQ